MALRSCGSHSCHRHYQPGVATEQPALAVAERLRLVFGKSQKMGVRAESKKSAGNFCNRPLDASPISQLAAQCAMQESGHLPSRDQTVRTEHVVVGWVAAALDARCAQPVYVTLENRRVVIDE